MKPKVKQLLAHLVLVATSTSINAGVTDGMYIADGLNENEHIIVSIGHRCHDGAYLAALVDALGAISLRGCAQIEGDEVLIAWENDEITAHAENAFKPASEVISEAPRTDSVPIFVAQTKNQEFEIALRGDPCADGAGVVAVASIRGAVVGMGCAIAGDDTSVEIVWHDKSASKVPASAFAPVTQD